MTPISIILACANIGSKCKGKSLAFYVHLANFSPKLRCSKNCVTIFLSFQYVKRPGWCCLKEKMTFWELFNRTAASMPRWPGTTGRSSHTDLPSKSEGLRIQIQLRNTLISWTFAWFMVRIGWNTRRPERFIEVLFNLHHSLAPRESRKEKWEQE